MSSVVDSRGVDHRRLWVLSMLLGVGLLLHTSRLQSGFVSTVGATAALPVKPAIPAWNCRIPAQAIGPAVKALSRDIARRFHVAESAAIGITHAAFTAGRIRGIDPMLVLAIAAVESKFKSRAVNAVTGATGLMQVMPQWHQDKIMNVGGDSSLLLIEPNITVGTAIIADYLDAEDGNLENALGRYLGTVGGVHYTKMVQMEMRHLQRVLEAV